MTKNDLAARIRYPRNSKRSSDEFLEVGPEILVVRPLAHIPKDKREHSRPPARAARSLAIIGDLRGKISEHDAVYFAEIDAQFKSCRSRDHIEAANFVLAELAFNLRAPSWRQLGRVLLDPDGFGFAFGD